MAATRLTTVLFADLAGSMRLYTQAGDQEAVKSIARCLDALTKEVAVCGGRVVKTIGDEVMALFPFPDAAAEAAVRMQAAIRDLPTLGGERLAIRIGFHTGPVIQRSADVFGDTVNIASRLAEHASKGQALTSDKTVALLSPALRHSTRRLYDVTLRGKADEVGLCELLWQPDPDITVLAPTERRHARAKLRLKYRDQSIVSRRALQPITIGRDPGCEVVICGAHASRQHCQIEPRRNRFVLRDHSTNGTYLTLEGDEEILLRREEHSLHGHGWIAFGERRSEALDVLEFFCG
jgi:adenylate cyclase